MDKFLEIADCVDKLLVDNFLHENGYDHKKSADYNLQKLMEYIKTHRLVSKIDTGVSKIK